MSEERVAGANRPWLAAAFSVAWIAIQLAVPAVAWRARAETGRTQPFGWQMFSSKVSIDRYQVVAADGSVVDVRVDDHAYRSRIDVPFETRLPAHLCRSMPEARSIRRVPRDGGAIAVHPCR